MLKEPKKVAVPCFCPIRSFSPIERWNQEIRLLTQQHQVSASLSFRSQIFFFVHPSSKLFEKSTCERQPPSLKKTTSCFFSFWLLRILFQKLYLYMRWKSWSEFVLERSSKPYLIACYCVTTGTFEIQIFLL